MYHNIPRSHKARPKRVKLFEAVEKKYYSINEIAEFVNKSRYKVRQRIIDLDIPIHQDGKKCRIRVSRKNCKKYFINCTKQW
jgi:hypothetical protein